MLQSFKCRQQVFLFNHKRKSFESSIKKYNIFFKPKIELYFKMKKKKNGTTGSKNSISHLPYKTLPPHTSFPTKKLSNIVSRSRSVSLSSCYIYTD